MPPESRLRIGACDVLAIGTIAGFVPDAGRVRDAFTALHPERVALGVPPEDLATLLALASQAGPVPIGPHEAPPGKRGLTSPGAGSAGLESLLRPSKPAAGSPPAPPEASPSLAGLDALSARFLDLLAAHGAVRLPSPDLEMAWHLAAESGTPVEALDLDDETHAAYYARQVGFFGLVRRQRTEAQMLRETVAAPDAYALAIEWDRRLNASRALRRVEQERERHMAARLGAMASACRRLLAVVPAARFAGVAARLAPVPQG